ncbi:glycosyltransferase [bacterium]|nr:glycosyltransferase [bacterium]
MSIDVSCIITNWNNGHYLSRAIRSCLKQSLGRDKYEIIVIDDASTDSSLDVIESFKDKIVSVKLDQNVGVAEASNIGIKQALGKFIVRVDADDYIGENTLLFLTEILNANPDLGFVYSDHLRVDQNENVLERVNITTPDLLFRHGAGILFRKSYLEAIGLYDKELKNAEDYDLLKRYLKNYDGYHLKLPLYRYRQHETNMTKSQEERLIWENKSNEKNN